MDRDELFKGFHYHEDVNRLIMRGTNGPEPLTNGKFKDHLPFEDDQHELGCYLNEWGETYLSEKNYKNAETVFSRIEEKELWGDDEFLKASTCSLMASLYFNIAIKKHVGSKYKDKEFGKAMDYASIACECNVEESVESRCKLGAWQVQYCVNILLNNCIEACRVKAQHNIYFLVERQRNPFFEQFNWHVGNEYGDDKLENLFNKELKDFLFKNPDKFDDLIDLHKQYKDAWNYTEKLAYASVFVENNFSRRAVLYNDLLEYVSIPQNGFDDYFFILINKLGADVYSSDKGEIKRTLQKLDNLTEMERYNDLPQSIKQKYYVIKLYALVELNDYNGVISLADSLSYDEKTEQVLYCLSNALEQLGELDQAERAGISSLSAQLDAFKVQSMGKIYYDRLEYEKSYEMYSWGIEGTEKDISRGERIIGPISIIELGRPAKEVLRELYVGAIDSLLMLNKYNEAKQYYDKYAKIQGTTDKNQLLMKINRMEELYKEGQSANETNKRIRDELEEKNNTIREMVEMQHQWYNDLLSCQILNQNTSISDDMWKRLSIDKKMDGIIDKIKLYIDKTHSSAYTDSYDRVKERYPNLSQKALGFLATAEQMFSVFSINPLIDFAPVLVEYGRVFEESIWNYLDNSSIYKKAAEPRAKEYGRTLGTAAHVIGENPGPLKKYKQQIWDITKMRNDSAHAYISKEPEIKEIRAMIWADGQTLLDEL